MICFVVLRCCLSALCCVVLVGTLFLVCFSLLWLLNYVFVVFRWFGVDFVFWFYLVCLLAFCFLGCYYVTLLFMFAGCGMLVGWLLLISCLLFGLVPLFVF